MDKYIGKRLDGRYEIKEIIGVGGMAYVYKAYDNIDDRVVAVKILKEEYLANDEFTRRFKNESKAIAILSHPNIVKVYDVSFGDRMQYIVMEYIDGITLKEYIDQQEEFKWKEAVHFTVQILRALQHAHDKGIVHRDIKPQNIMLLPDGTIKVTDFGIARFSRQDIRTTRSTDKAIGSVHYISPEQARGEITDEKADIYSVGVMLYEMLAGKLPFEADSAVSVAIMQLQSEAKPPREINPSIPEGLQDITVKAMQKDPSKRYQSAAEMLYDIDEFKKNPSIHFEYKYFVDESPTRYMETISRVKGQDPEAVGAKGADQDEEKKPFPIIPVLSAIAAAFVLVAIAFVVFVVKGGGIFGGGKNPNPDTDTADTIVVPNLVGKHIDEISADAELMANFIFDAQNQKEEFSDKPVGTVLKQSLQDGIRVKKGTKTIVLTISKGQDMVQLPDVVGGDWHRRDAQAQLEQLGFKVSPVEDYSDTIAEGFVISLSPAEYPHKMPYGSDVTLVYSKGPKPIEPVAMPNVRYISKDQAIAQLQAAGFVVLEENIKYVNDANYMTAGTVIKQNITPDTEVPVDTKIELTVSTGFTDVEMEIPMPDSAVMADVYVFVNGEARPALNKTMIVPNAVQYLKLTMTEQLEEYDVLIMMCGAGRPSGEAKVYGTFKVYGKQGLWSPVGELDADVMDQFETTTPTTTQPDNGGGDEGDENASTDESTGVQP